MSNSAPLVVRSRRGARLHYLRHAMPGSSSVRTLCGVSMGRALARHYAGAVGMVSAWPICNTCERIYHTRVFLNVPIRVMQQGEL